MQTTSVERKELGGHFDTPEEYHGYEVCDPLGNRVGTVEQVFVNGAGEPEYIRTRVGLLGIKHVLLPVKLVAVDYERRALLLR